MKQILAFFKLIRIANLFFIVVTQVVFYFFIFLPLLHPEQIYFQPNQKGEVLFFLLVLASFFIAAGGNIINDYFDVQIDHLNKPQRVIVGKMIKRRWVMAWHLIFSFLGLVISAWISFQSQQWIVFVGNTACVILLFFYSTHFKRKMLIGNLVVSVLTGWVILVIYFYVGASFLGMGVWRTTGHIDMKKLFILTFMYAAFAFVITLIREVVKDLEDMYGDSRFHCKTLPIALGVPVAKVFTAVWMVVAVIGLLLLQLYAWHAGWWWSVVYGFIFITIPLIYAIWLLYKANESQNYQRISGVLKWVMLFGILSMIFFKFLQ